MYDDHLKVVNPGSFHFGFTPENLVRPHASKPWNSIIAEVENGKEILGDSHLMT